MKNLLIALLCTLTSLSLCAQNKTDKIVQDSFTVQGICEMCKARIEKAALYTPGVKLAVWDQEKLSLKVVYKSDKTSIDKISKNIAKAGYATQYDKAEDEAYKELPDCCKYNEVAPH